MQEAEVVVVENEHHLNKFVQIAHELPALKALVVANEDVPQSGALSKLRC